MDFDKLKKAAKDTIKMVSNKVEEKLSRDDDEDIIELHADKPIYDDIDDFTENEDIMGSTRRFDMKDALNRFRKHKDDIEESISELINNDTSEKENSSVNEIIETNLSDISESISDIDSDISLLSANYSQEMKKIDEGVKELTERLDKINETSKNTNSALSTLSQNLESSIMDINKKLSDITSSISGVNKINDSIFDLKNSQINTKNFLGDLEASFNNLKKKTTAGITILSIISAVIAVLEVINLLS